MAKLLLIVSGGIAAYKACELIRLAHKAGHEVTPVLTKGGAEFVTALTLGALSERPVYTDLFSLKDETEMGHIRLAREADLIVVAPASANLIARYAQGRADDLAATLLLAADGPVLLAPAMNPVMWDDPATQSNIKALAARDNLHLIGPMPGDMACGETGTGRLAEPADILAKIDQLLGLRRTLTGLHAIVTSGPTHEPLDPVRFIGNRSSGRQGHAIAEALRDAGATVTLVTGPVALPDPHGMKIIKIETAEQMHESVHKSLPTDIFVGAAAVSDWFLPVLPQKYKKKDENWAITLQKTPDILQNIGHLPQDQRPKLVIGFALESENVENHALDKLKTKKADALLVNSVNGTSIPFGAAENHLRWLDNSGFTDWGHDSKIGHAKRLVSTISQHIKGDVK